jgi:CRISPR-associated protein Cas1
MIKRTVEISGQGNQLSVRHGSLFIVRDGELVGQVPMEDLGVLVLDAPTTTYTHAVIVEALAAGAVIVPCGPNHHPCGLFLPQNNSLQSRRLRNQAASPLPLRKALWKQLIQAKIRNQASVLDKDHPARLKLSVLVSRVRSGDPTNVEAQAARAYWPALFDASFRRSPEGPAPNNLLNYGYAILRAAVARGICAAGLHPSLGLHHQNQYNDFCLADDLLEPLRPVVDRKVLELCGAGLGEVDRETKPQLLSLLTEEIEVAGERGPLFVAIERVTASLVACFAGERKNLELPKLCF